MAHLEMFEGCDYFGIQLAFPIRIYTFTSLSSTLQGFDWDNRDKISQSDCVFILRSSIYIQHLNLTLFPEFDAPTKSISGNRPRIGLLSARSRQMP